MCSRDDAVTPKTLHARARRVHAIGGLLAARTGPVAHEDRMLHRRGKCSGPKNGRFSMAAQQTVDTLDQRSILLASSSRAPEIPEAADIYGWLVGSWEL